MTQEDLGPFADSITDAEVKAYLQDVWSLNIYFSLREYVNPLTEAIQSCYEQEYNLIFNLVKRGIVELGFYSDAPRSVCHLADDVDPPDTPYYDPN